MGAIATDKIQRVRRLYYDKKLSAKEIAEDLNVSIDAVYFFMRLHDIKRRSYSEEQRLRFLKKPSSYIVKKDLSSEEQELRTAGIILYWGEGYKAAKAHAVDFANSDPAMIVTFVAFLRRICGVKEDRLRVFL